MSDAALRVIVSVALLCAGWPVTAAAQTLERISATKIVRIGYIAEQAPFASASAGGEPNGYAIDLCNRIADQIVAGGGGVTANYVETTLAEAFDAVANDRIDLLCGAITATLGRRATVDFSEPIFLTGMSALLRANAPRDLRELFLGERTISPPRSPAMRPFATSRIGVRTDTTTEAILHRKMEQEGYGAAIVGFANHSEGLAALEAGDIDAYFADRALLAELHRQARRPSELILGSRLLTNEPYGIAMKRGDSELRLLVDKTLSQFFVTPDFMELLKAYFGDEAAALQQQIRAHAIPE
jgi:ABC-type amino acid transport substrate-binding protein